MARIEPGCSIDGFQVVSRIHKGGMAVLWEVAREDFDLPLLMKVPVLSEGVDPAAIVGFEMEQMILPRLSGPHVPRHIATGDFSVQPYLVMERIPSDSLLPLLRRLPLPYPEVAAIGARVAIALSSLHRQHVVHLDIKPSNILTRPDGKAVLIDYGLSHHQELPDLMGAEFRLPYGTAPYMAPEQVLGHRNDPRSDQFALGVMMYFFATGVRPFGDPQRLSGLKRRLWRDPVPPRRYREDFPPWLQEVILRCLEVNPAWRYPSSTQLAFELQNPDQVKLTGRSDKLRQDPFSAVLRRRFREEPLRPASTKAAAAIDDDSPIIAVAVDLAESSAAVAAELRTRVSHLLGTHAGARVACLNVLKQGLITLDTTLDKDGRNKHLQRLVELRQWAEPLGLDESRVSFHVLESPQPAHAILRYAQANHVDHIVLGARASSVRRTLLGSVSKEVAANASCTVTVVRARMAAPGQAEAGEGKSEDSWTVG
jgi:non-specific serine/threonine protein kinase/protein-serine/threonine kinase